MPFPAYGVLAGTLTRSYRDDPDNAGRWFHVHLVVDSAGTTFEVAVDVDSHQSNTGVQWKRLTVTSADLAFPSLPTAGFHSLVSAPGTGALDVIRHPSLRTVQVVRVLRWVISLIGTLPWAKQWTWLPVFRPWSTGDWAAATIALEGLLSPGATVLVWGEPWPKGAPAQHAVEGVHNVHQNQGDPIGSQWEADDGIWQDGGVAVQQLDGRWRVFVSRFSSQADRTDSGGHPA